MLCLQADKRTLIRRVTFDITALPPRGVYDALGSKVSRYARAQLVTPHDNPLTAWVAVNGYLQLFFGVGIVKSAEEFGNYNVVNSPVIVYIIQEFVTHLTKNESTLNLKVSHRFKEANMLPASGFLIVRGYLHRAVSDTLVNARDDRPHELAQFVDALLAVGLHTHRFV